MTMFTSIARLLCSTEEKMATHKADTADLPTSLKVANCDSFGDGQTTKDERPGCEAKVMIGRFSLRPD